MSNIPGQLPHPTATKRILIVEDHAILRDGLKAILSDFPEFKVVGEAADGLEGVSRFKELNPDLVLLDMTMPKMNGLEALAEMKKIHPASGILILSVHRSQTYCKAALRAGADGYALKDSCQDELLEAIQKILKGQKYISRDLRSEEALEPEPSLNQSLKSDRLTKREIQILKLVAEGNTNKEIANLLFISPKTVDNHRTNLMRKLDLHNVQDLTRYAEREKLLAEN